MANSAKVALSRGHGTTINRSTPVDVIGLSGGAGAQAVHAGDRHTCALTASNGVKCWGWNAYGQLGDGTTITRITAVDVIGLASGVKSVVGGGTHTCALTASNGVKCWGANFNGELGDGTTINRSTPVDVSGLTGGVQQVSLRGSHTCALTNSGGVKCWGDNTYGQLGDGTTINRSMPVDVIGLTGGVRQIAVIGLYSACALLVSGGVKCWGANELGQLGDGTTINRLTPVDVVGLSVSATVNFLDGKPGSFFQVTATNFSPGAQAVVTVNGRVLTPTLPTGTGVFSFTLTTAQASSGAYFVVISSPAAASTRSQRLSGGRARKRTLRSGATGLCMRVKAPHRSWTSRLVLHSLKRCSCRSLNNNTVDKMNTTSLLAEFLVVGLIQFAAITFAVLDVLRFLNIHIDDLAFSQTLKDYPTLLPLTLVLTLVIYLLGALGHRFIQVLMDVSWIGGQFGTYKMHDGRNNKLPYVEEHGSPAVVAKIEYHESMVRMFASTAVYTPVLALWLAIWFFEACNLLGVLLVAAVCGYFVVVSAKCLRTQEEISTNFVDLAERTICAERAEIPNQTTV